MIKNSKFQYLLIVPVLLMMMALISHPVYATETPGDGIVGAGEVIDDDVVLSAENPSMLGTVNGMLIILGDHALVDGTVNGDVIAMGNYVEIGENAHITGNIFGGGYILRMAGKVDGSLAGGSNTLVLDQNSTIGRNLYFGSFSNELKESASIGSDAYIGAYQAILAGSIGRDLNIGAAAVQLSGRIGRNATMDVASPDNAEPMPYFMFPMNAQNQNLPRDAQELIPIQEKPGLTISDTAEIGGKLIYTSPQPQEQTILVTPPEGTVYQTPVPEPESADQGERPIVFQDAEKGTTAFVAGMILTWVWHVIKAFITLLLIALLAFWLVPQKFEQSLQVLKSKPGKSFGYGMLAFFGGFALLFFGLILVICFTAFLAVITFGTLGFYFFLIGFSTYFLAFALFLLLTFVGSKILVAYFVGEWLLNIMSKTPTQGRALPLILGLVVYILVGYVPVLGFIVRAMMTFFGAGAILIVLLDSWQARKTKALPTE